MSQSHTWAGGGPILLLDWGFQISHVDCGVGRGEQSVCWGVLTSHMEGGGVLISHVDLERE